jgi:hypothetical protein
VIEGELQDGENVCGIEAMLVQGRAGLTTRDELAVSEAIWIVQTEALSQTGGDLRRRGGLHVR